MRILIGNLDPNASRDQVRELFVPFGVVASVRLIRDRATGRSRGFGYVEMDQEQEARAAIAGLNGRNYDGWHDLEVARAGERPGGSAHRLRGG